MDIKRVVSSGLAIACVAAVALTAPFAATAKEKSKAVPIPGGTISAYAYIQNLSDWSGCGSFKTRASASKKLASIKNGVEWDPVGIGASAQIKGVGVSVSGNNGGSPTASITGKNTSSAGIQGTACMSWSTIYLGVFSTATSRINNTLYTSTVHL